MGSKQVIDFIKKNKKLPSQDSDLFREMQSYLTPADQKYDMSFRFTLRELCASLNMVRNENNCNGAGLHWENILLSRLEKREPKDRSKRISYPTEDVKNHIMERIMSYSPRDFTGDYVSFVVNNGFLPIQSCPPSRRLMSTQSKFCTPSSKYYDPRVVMMLAQCFTDNEVEVPQTARAKHFSKLIGKLRYHKKSICVTCFKETRESELVAYECPKCHGHRSLRTGQYGVDFIY